MGTNFGNIHVRTNDLNDVIAALKELSSTRSRIEPNPAMFSDFESLLQYANQMKNIYYVGQMQPGWISILNDSFGWGEVEAFAETLSSYMNSSLLSISYFDDDLFEMNVYANGAQITGQIWCSEDIRETYGVERKQADITDLAEVLGHKHISKLIEILNIQTCDQAVEALQDVMQIPLWIHSDWFDHMEGQEALERYKQYDFNH